MTHEWWDANISSLKTLKDRYPTNFRTIHHRRHVPSLLLGSSVPPRCPFPLPQLTRPGTLQVFPIVGGVVWLGTLLGLLLYWLLDAGRAHYASMAETQHIAYISDVGAQELKPLFVAGCVVTSVLLSLSFAADRWLRHKGRLAPNTTRGEKVLSALAIVFAVVGTVGLILLSVFDTLRYQRQHSVFLLLFIVGYVLSAIFICWEYQRLGMRMSSLSLLSPPRSSNAPPMPVAGC